MSLQIKTDVFTQQRTLPNLSAKESLVLRLLLNAGRELYGLEMVKASDGGLKRGTIYVTLGRMEIKGYIESRKEENPPKNGGMPRRLYKFSAYGRRVFEAWELAYNSYAESALAWT